LKWKEIKYIKVINRKMENEKNVMLDKCIKDLDRTIERLEMEFPLIYKQISEPVAIGLSDCEEKDFMKIMIIPELKRIIKDLNRIKKEI